MTIAKEWWEVSETGVELVRGTLCGDMTGCVAASEESRKHAHTQRIRGWQATRVQLLTDLGNRNITNHHKCSSRYKDMKFGLNF